MTEQEIQTILSRQKEYFATGATLSRKFRAKQLGKLKASLQRHETELNDALQQDLGKSRMESYMCEIGLTLSELTWMQKHLRGLMREKRVPTPLSQFAARSFRSPSPYGTVLIMSPWNYPFMLTIEPLIDALAAGNTAILKPSAYSAHTTALISRMIQECFDEKYVAVVTGGREENNFLLNEHFDYIFFTGSQEVGKEVMRHASNHLTPITLELGGKSPCIVHKSADIKLAAKRIVFGKFLNCGQTCVAPDYIYCDRTVKDKLIKELKKQIQKQYSKQPLAHKEYGKIINLKHFDRLLGLIDYDKVVYGGTFDHHILQIEPTIMDNVTFSDAVMQEEIFGPVVVVQKFKTADEVIALANDSVYGLGGAVFSKNIDTALKVARAVRTGRMWVNTYNDLPAGAPFGGYKQSGIGRETHKVMLEHYSQTKNILINLREGVSGMYDIK